ncbi:MAG: DUF3089 domain-containing protein [Bacteroidota bacterium]
MSILQKIKGQVTKYKKRAEKVKYWLDFARQVRPTSDFNENKIPTPPNYSSFKSWAAHPDIEHKASFTPEGTEPASEDQLRADVFFIHPTTYFGNSNWNMPLGHEVATRIVDEVIMPGQTSVFNSCCRIFAPRYRQATFYSFLEGGKNGRKALELAYSDVARAFDYFIQNLNDGRPFFIASHSQGTVHATRLIEEKIDKTDLVDRMVAAYTIGFQFPKVKFENDLKNIKPSQSPTDTQCVVAFDTYVESGGPLATLDRTEHFFSKKDGTWEWKKRANLPTFGVNPLTWTTDLETVDATKHLGGVRNVYTESYVEIKSLLDDEIAKIEAKHISAPFLNEVSARLGKDGILYISQPKSRIFRVMLLPNGNYHNYDYSLFYMNLRKNVQDRLEAFLHT